MERAWLDIAARTLGTATDFPTLDRLTPLADDLSDSFTTERQPGFHDYSASQEHWLAYGAFFFPQTFVRMRFVLEECLGQKGWRPASERSPIRVLDLGAGTGAATAAAVLTLNAHLPKRSVDVLAVDESDAALRLLRTLFAHGIPGVRADQLNTKVASIRGFHSFATDDKWDLITAGFSLNEVLETTTPGSAERWVREALSHLSPGGLLVVLEPALHVACERMERLRDAIAAQGLARIVAPCPHHQRCPMLAMPEVWCHDIRRWKVPESVAYINRKLQRSVQQLKFCFLALTARDIPEHDPCGIAFCRIVAPMSEPRGRICTFGCAADGLIHPYEIQTRNLNGDQKSIVRRLERGDCMVWSDPQLLGDGRTVRGTGAT